MPWPNEHLASGNPARPGERRIHEAQCWQEESSDVEASDDLSGVENVEGGDQDLRERLRLQGLAHRPVQVTAVQRARFDQP